MTPSPSPSNINLDAPYSPTPTVTMCAFHLELQMREMDGNRSEWRNSAITFDHVGWAYMALLQIATFKVGAYTDGPKPC